LYYSHSFLQITDEYNIENPTVPNLKLIREHLLAEGSIAKAELVKLVKDVI
jgi:hypothetical protein